ncbi:MAG: TonB-dependent receptor [Pseudomonadota bacterium]
MTLGTLGQAISVSALATAMASAPAAAQSALPQEDERNTIEATPAAQSAFAMDPSLLESSLEELLVREATSVAKKRQKVRDSAAAVYVITQEDIRNSPHATVVDLLRTVPGVEVGQLGNAATAVTIRGFNGRNANSLLVMIDGRSIYVSTLSGVFWDQLMLPLSDIERIEVVRGPGATLWGANAVNGVINIITKNSADTLGTRALARASTRRQELTLSQGFRASDDLTIRAHGAYQRDELLVDAQGNDLAGRAREGGEVGVRLDWQASPKDAITLQADYSGADFVNAVDLLNLNPLNPTLDRLMPEEEFEQFSVLGRWSRTASETLRWRAQAYYSYLDRTELGLARYTIEIADFDLGVNWTASETHDLSLGVGARVIDDKGFSLGANSSFNNDIDEDIILSGYIQDDITLIPDSLNVTVGAKLEHNNFTGFEFQPSARVFYRPAKALGLWGSVSRAVRTPSRFERSADLAFQALPANSEFNPLPISGFATLVGNPDLGSEELTALEAGLRYDFARNWNLDLAAYYNFYSDVVTPTPIDNQLIFVPGVPFPVGFVLMTEPQDRGELETWGLEASVSGQFAPWWSLRATASNLNFSKEIDPRTGEEFALILSPTTSPKYQASLTNTFEIAPDLQLSTQLRYVSELLEGEVPDYLTGDFRLRYEAGRGLEFSLIGENLFQEEHLEFVQPSYPTPPAFVPRTVSAELRFRF